MLELRLYAITRSMMDAEIPTAVVNSEVESGRSPAVPDINVLACMMRPIVVPTRVNCTQVSPASQPNSAFLSIEKAVARDNCQHSEPEYSDDTKKSAAIKDVIMEKSPFQIICGI
jgi:hypothetical protein